MWGNLLFLFVCCYMTIPRADIAGCGVDNSMDFLEDTAKIWDVDRNTNE